MLCNQLGVLVCDPLWYRADTITICHYEVPIRHYYIPLGAFMVHLSSSDQPTLLHHLDSQPSTKATYVLKFMPRQLNEGAPVVCPTSFSMPCSSAGVPEQTQVKSELMVR